MKKIVTGSTPGGAPLYLGDFKTTFNDEIWDAMQALLSGYDSDTEGLIISGCVISGAGPYNMTAGIVYLNGEFMRIDAQVGIGLPQYIQPLATVNTSRQFENNTNQVLFEEKSATVAGSAPGAGQYVAITSTTDAEDRRIGKYQQPKTKVLPIGVWNMDADGSSPNIPHGINSGKIVGYQIMIFDDSGVGKMFVEDLGAVLTSYDATNFSITRIIGGQFDTASYDSTAINRGFITVFYTI